MSAEAFANTPLWQAGATGESYPDLVGEHGAEVCVVGLGGSGLTAIDELTRAGCDVIGLDRGKVAGGAAGRNGGLLLAGLAPFYHVAREELGSARARALYAATIDERARIASTAPAFVRRTGSLRIADSEHELEDCEAHLDALRADGFPCERYSGAWGRGLSIPDDMSFDPLGRCRALAADLARRGARLHESSEAIEIGASAVRTPKGFVRADRVLVAVDGGLDVVLPELRGEVRTARLQMLGTAPATDVTIDTPMYLRHGYEYVQQLPNGSLALGGFRDRFEQEEWTHVNDPSQVVQDALTTFLRDRIGSDASVTHRWAASVGFSRSAMPVFAAVRGGVIAFGGYSGTGNLVGALAGRAAAALVAPTASEAAHRLVPLFAP